MTSALDWKPGTEPPTALPFGWTDAAIATVHHMARDLGIDPLDMLALFYSESGLNPAASPEGLAGLTPVVEDEMGWPPGTIHQLNTGPIVGYLQAVYQLWTHTQEKYVGTSYASRASSWGVSPGTALYVYHGFLGPALGAGSSGGSATVLGQKPPVWPVTWGQGGWIYQGQPIADVLGRPLSGKEQLYAGNPGLDRGQKGAITIGDMAARVAGKGNELRANPKTNAIYEHMRAIDALPPSSVPPLTSLFGAVQGVWKQLTGTNVRTDPGPQLAGESPSRSGAPATPAAESPSSGAGPVLLLAAVAAAWALWRARKR